MEYLGLIIFVVLKEAHIGIAMETKKIVCKECMVWVHGSVL